MRFEEMSVKLILSWAGGGYNQNTVNLSVIPSHI